MRILYLTDQMYLHGGAERIIANKMNYLIQNDGHEVFLITSEQKGNSFVYELDNRLHHIDLGINYHRETSYFSPKNLQKMPIHYWKLRRKIRQIRPDVIVQVSYSPDQYFLPWMLKKIPKIKEFHSSGSVMLPGTNQYKLAVLFKNYDQLVVLNDSEVQYYPGMSISIIPNFTNNSAVKEILPREKTIIAAGRIAPVKQFDKLVKIWSKLANKYPDWTLKIFGDGTEYDVNIVQNLIHQYQISNNTKIMGAVSDLQSELEKSALYAMTSLTECFPMVLLEAQSAGVPVVSFDCPNGPKHIVNTMHNGILVTDQDEEAFAQALAALMENEDLRLRYANDSISSVEKYGKAKVMQKWNDLFKSLINQKK